MSTVIEILKANYVPLLKVEVFFSDNSSKIIDIGSFIKKNPHPQYNKYLDEKLFQTFTIEDGNIVWGQDWDLIFPLEQLHEGSLS